MTDFTVSQRKQDLAPGVKTAIVAGVALAANALIWQFDHTRHSAQALSAAGTWGLLAFMAPILGVAGRTIQRAGLAALGAYLAAGLVEMILANQVFGHAPIGSTVGAIVIGGWGAAICAMQIFAPHATPVSDLDARVVTWTKTALRLPAGRS